MQLIGICTGSVYLAESLEYIDRCHVRASAFCHVGFFGRPFVKRFALCYRSVVCPVCPVCDVRALWPNGWTDQDETWHAGRPLDNNT